MANPDPWQARLKRWEKQWPVPIGRLQAQAYAVLQLAYEGITVDDADQRRKNIHVYFTALSTLAKLLESTPADATPADAAHASDNVIVIASTGTNGHHDELSL